MLRTTARAAVLATGLALMGGLVAAPAMAADGYDATIAGQRNFTPLVNLASSSTQTVQVVNLPAGVGLYALHCEVPADPRSAPTLCDLSTDAAGYLPASDADRASATMAIKVNGEFYGMNPNPTAAAASGESVDCRADTGNPRSTTCAVYILGAGKESANPAYIRLFPTSFLPVSAQRANDAARVELDGAVVRRGAKPRLSLGQPEKFMVTLRSGLTPSLSSDNCSIDSAKGTITALKNRGTCTVRITSTGGKNVKPLVKTQVFRLTK